MTGEAPKALVRRFQEAVWHGGHLAAVEAFDADGLVGVSSGALAGLRGPAGSLRAASARAG
jgi:hypothetical protein